VLYSESRETWFAVNAVLRAKKMGYKNVSWYRGGLVAWQAAGLPTVPQLPRAALDLR
jgi:3-mercaptopyruvate sulfurtransferase SseA